MSNTNPAALLAAVQTSVTNRAIDATVRVSLETGNKVVLSATATLGERQCSLSTSFVFDGDLVLLRGFGRAADDLSARINQARHLAWSVA